MDELKELLIELKDASFCCNGSNAVQNTSAFKRAEGAECKIIELFTTRNQQVGTEDNFGNPDQYNPVGDVNIQEEIKQAAIAFACELSSAKGMPDMSSYFYEMAENSFKKHTTVLLNYCVIIQNIKLLKSIKFTDDEAGCMDCQATTIVDKRITTLENKLNNFVRDINVPRKKETQK